MIQSFKDKLKKKQEAYEAKQQVLAEQAEQARIAEEWKLFDEEQKKISEKNNQILIEEESRQHAEYLQWKHEQKMLQEQLEQMPLQKVNSGIGMGHSSTWKLTWKSFSEHPDIIDLPMSEKIRLFKLAERQQIDKLNYYTSYLTAVGSGKNYWEDGVVDKEDVEEYELTSITEDTVWTNSVDLNSPITIEAGVTLTVQGILTANALITNHGTIRVIGLIIENISVNNLGAGQIIVG